jgi:protein SCO1/2
MATMGARRRGVFVLGGIGVLLIAGAFAVRLATGDRIGAAPDTSSKAVSAVRPDDLKSLRNHDGQRFSFTGMRGRTVVMNFIFTHCPVSCPLQTRALIAIQRTLPRPLQARVHFLSVSMDPARDTSSVLKQYATTLGADLRNWSFVTGGDDEIAWLHKHFNAQVKRAARGQFDHRVAVYLLDANRQLIQTYTGDLDQARLVKEIGEVDSLYNKS